MSFSIEALTVFGFAMTTPDYSAVVYRLALAIALPLILTILEITMPRPTAHFLSGEGRRNRTYAQLFTRLLARAWGDCDVIVGHHVAFQFDHDLQTEDEIPSADTLLFDHGVMIAVFGVDAIPLMQRIATMLPGEREAEVERCFNALEG